MGDDGNQWDEGVCCDETSSFSQMNDPMGSDAIDFVSCASHHQQTLGSDVVQPPDDRVSLPNCFYMLLRGEDTVPSHPVENPKRIVLLHGWLQTHSCWLTTAVKLRDRFGHSVLMMDFYGHGRSPYLEDYKLMDIKTFSRQLRTVLERVGWVDEPICIAGISMGGAVTQRYLLDFPDHVERILLLASAGMEEDKWYIVTPYFGRLLNVFFRLLEKANEKVNLDWILNKQPFRAVLSRFHICRETPTYGLPQAEVKDKLNRTPTTVIWGKYDFLHSPQLRKLKHQHEDINVKIYPWMEHTLFCCTIDFLNLHEYSHFWHGSQVSHGRNEDTSLDAASNSGSVSDISLNIPSKL